MKQWWVFTFGYGQSPGIGYYAKYYGTYSEAREQMCEKYGIAWAFQYESEEAAGCKKFNLKCVNEVNDD